MTFQLYADAKPSEVLKKQQNNPAALAVACILPYKPNTPILDVPVKQYKEVPTKKKAIELKNWLIREKELGLIFRGFLVARSLKSAARFGLEMLEELPDTGVKSFERDGRLVYRLIYGNKEVDLLHAVALAYYYLPLSFGALKVYKSIAPDEERDVMILLDRFPAAAGGDRMPGESAPETQGIQFLKYFRAHSETAKAIDSEDKKAGLTVTHTTLEWWAYSTKEIKRSDLIKGNKHPHFTLVDWLVAGALANSFKDEFIEEFPNRKKAVEVANALIELYKEYKKNGVWEIADDKTLDLIKGGDKKWVVSEEVKSFVMNNTGN